MKYNKPVLLFSVSLSIAYKRTAANSPSAESQYRSPVAGASDLLFQMYFIMLAA